LNTVRAHPYETLELASVVRSFEEIHPALELLHRNSVLRLKHNKRLHLESNREFLIFPYPAAVLTWLDNFESSDPAHNAGEIA
jgi:hypothetical protein